MTIEEGFERLQRFIDAQWDVAPMTGKTAGRDLKEIRTERERLVAALDEIATRPECSDDMGNDCGCRAIADRALHP